MPTGHQFINVALPATLDAATNKGLYKQSDILQRVKYQKYYTCPVFRQFLIYFLLFFALGKMDVIYFFCGHFSERVRT